MEKTWKLDPQQYTLDTIKKTTTYFKTRVRSLIACTATSYSLSRVMETMRSCAKRDMRGLLGFIWLVSEMMSVQWQTNIHRAWARCLLLCVRVWNNKVGAVVLKVSSRWCWPWSGWWRAPVLRWALCCSRDPAELSDTSDVPRLAGIENQKTVIYPVHGPVFLLSLQN